MRVARAEDVPMNPTRGMRSSKLRFKVMLGGTEGSPDNYRLLIADADPTFTSPRHRHNFDQVRVGLEDGTNIGPNRNIMPGEVAYFPEGTYYGPQNQGETGRHALTMVVQFGGPSGEGFLSQEALDAGYDAMSAFGTFDRGVFRRSTPAPDGRINQDAFEAVWEHRMGRKLRYPKPRYMEPIHVREEAYQWVALADTPGVARRHLGSFTEKEVGLDYYRIDADATLALAPTPGQTRLLFVKDGTGCFGNGAAWSQWTAAHLDPGETTTLAAETETVVLVLAMAKRAGASAGMNNDAMAGTPR